MGLVYLNYLHQENFTSPLSIWHRGTAFQIDVVKDHPQTPLVLTDPDTVVVLTMAVRILRSVMSLGKNILQTQASNWKMLPRICMSKALRAVVWMCWSVVGLLLPALMTTMYGRKKQSKNMCDTEQPMTAVTVKSNWDGQTEPVDKMVVEESCNLKMETDQEFAKMVEDYKHEKVMTKEGRLISCTNPVILSMICMPLEVVDSSEESEEEDSAGELEGDCSQEEMSLDSGMQESWTQSSRNENCDEESDWSDEDTWDEDSNPCNEGEDLWASFCRSDDPYNPFSFSMPTRSPGQPNKEPSIKSPETLQNCGTVTKKQKMKPVLSGYKSSHKCTLPKESSMEEGNQCTKKVRFSLKVTVHPIIAWSFAHRMARKGPWEEYARDRSRFRKRIAETEAAIGFCLTAPHREKIWATLYSNQN